MPSKAINNFIILLFGTQFKSKLFSFFFNRNKLRFIYKQIHCHSPLYFGVLFSANALSPSKRSFVGIICA